ncbi:hypothetical protein FQA39_LY02504 [Lamprigera yunnana]|nr:hypothetical protein FQA39_LY02504 [Lamprigera yunnana]
MTKLIYRYCSVSLYVCTLNLKWKKLNNYVNSLQFLKINDQTVNIVQEGRKNSPHRSYGCTLSLSTHGTIVRWHRAEKTLTILIETELSVFLNLLEEKIKLNVAVRLQ